jgi:aquaporin Z
MTPTPSPPITRRIGLWAADGLLLGLFMVSVGIFAGLIFSPASPAAGVFTSDTQRALAMGAAMGATLIALVYSPLGAFSGAHMNPAVTVAFLRLGRIRPFDAAGYIAAQIIGGLLGAVAIGAAVGPAFTGEPVRWAATTPGPFGVAAAFAAEFGMTLVLMLTVLTASNHARTARWTGLIAAALVTLYITFESPVSGMSMNPARTLASALPSGIFDAIWIYFTAPFAGMLAAAELFARLRCFPAAHCCKLNHEGPCLHCGCDGPIRFHEHTTHAPETPA